MRSPASMMEAAATTRRLREEVAAFCTAHGIDPEVGSTNTQVEVHDHQITFRLFAATPAPPEEAEPTALQVDESSSSTTM